MCQLELLFEMLRMLSFINWPFGIASCVVNSGNISVTDLDEGRFLWVNHEISSIKVQIEVDFAVCYLL